MSEYDNATVANLLDAVGDLLEIAGADKYRYLSYHKASHALRAWPEDVNETCAAGRLTEIPGVGKKLAAAIESILATGSFPELDEVKASLPGTIVELIRVPGLGPKKAKALYEELAIASIDDLEEAIAENRVAGLPGFGEKTVDNIRLGIEAYRLRGSRILLADALPLATKLVGEIRALEGVKEAAFAGSLRRMKETIGDIDILASSADPASVMSGVRELPLVTRVIASGETKTSVETTAGLQVDVRVVVPESWGAALQYFTGSAEHNVHLREIAKSRGLKINEYGVFRLADDTRVAGLTEEDVYAALGMPTPPPEVREDRGEIELAIEGRVPAVLELEDVRGDLHTHTVATDGASSIERNRAVAAELGYEYIACTDHAYDLRMVGGLSVEELERQWSQIDVVNAGEKGPVVLKGIELNIDDEGGVDYDDQVLSRFDIVLASLHSGWHQSREVATRRLLRAMENPYVDVISHPTGRLLGRRDPIDLDMEAVLEKAAETGTIMEINAYPDRLDLNAEHLFMARRLGVRFSLGTDAHEARQMAAMRYGVATARRGWCAPEDVLNAQPLEVLRTWLKRDRAGR